MMIPVDSLMMRCATCKFWIGNKSKAQKMYSDNPISMDLFDGWAEYASCSNSTSFMEVEINGDARVETEFAAGFGCILWES